MERERERERERLEAALQYLILIFFFLLLFTTESTVTLVHGGTSDHDVLPDPNFFLRQFLGIIFPSSFLPLLVLLELLGY